MIPELGLFSLILALALSAVLVLSQAAAQTQRFNYLSQLSVPTTVALCCFMVLSFASLVVSFALDDFSVAYVGANSNTQLPLMYKLCAAWGGHEGSLLLWGLILSVWILAFALLSKKLPLEFRNLTLGILGAITFGFVFIIVATSSPFLRELPLLPIEGHDLNPLLQDPGFVMHPPILYMGYVGMSVPFALALAFLIRPEQGLSWSRLALPWVLMAWAFLTLGITLGSWWAYYELGWGGWWFWDPVENASLMPWLAGGALVHALMISKNNEEHQAWALLLALSAFILSLIGTFLVRSGVVSSVHAFASDPERGVYILVFLAIVMTVSFAIYIQRVRFNWQQTHWLSKKSFLFLGSLLLFGSTCTVLLGTLYPIVIEVLTGAKLSVGAPYFNTVMRPIFILMLLLMFIGPVLPWTRQPGQRLQIQIRQKYKMGMVLAHFGFALSLAGMLLVSTLETESEIGMQVGETKAIQDYSFTFSGLKDIQASNSVSKQGHFIVRKNGQIIAQLYPEKRYFLAREMAMSETAIDPGFFKDFYIALGDKLDDNHWAVRIYIKPFVRWIWLGGVLIACGAVFSALTQFRREYYS